MINKGVRLTAGLLIAALFVTLVPADRYEAKTAESTNYITGASYSFSAGAHSAIGETVVLEDTTTDDEFFAGVEENDAPVVAGPENPYANIAIAKVNAYLNIRSAADASAPALGKLYNNGAAFVLETLDGWYKVTSGSVTGYVSAKYVVVGDEALCKSVSKRVGTILDEAVRLRKEASTNCGVITLLAKNKKVTVLDETLEGWYKVQYGSYTGYVAKQYVNVETAYDYAESKEEEAARKAAEAAKKQNQKKPSSYDKNYRVQGDTKGHQLVNYALQFVGNPYVWGGTSLTKGADCSGFVMKVYEKFGVKNLPHSSYKLRTVGYAVKASDVQPGDIICYSGHVAIYMGDGMIVHASSKKDGIKISYNWQYKKVLAIRRIF